MYTFVCKIGTMRKKYAIETSSKIRNNVLLVVNGCLMMTGNHGRLQRGGRGGQLHAPCVLCPASPAVSPICREKKNYVPFRLFPYIVAA